MDSRSSQSSLLSHVRWDRIGRVALLLLLVGIVYLYIQPAAAYISTWKDSKQQHSELAKLEAENRALRERRDALKRNSVIEREARKFGMVRPGETPYVVVDE